MSLFSDARNIVSLTTRHSDLALVGLLVAVIALMIMPLPTALVDTLIGANLALSFAIMMMTMYVRTPLEFSSFPTMLLFTTLFRVGLNITTTRLILLNADAGEIIQTFGEFALGGNFVVGAVVFLILTIVQFLVIAKGAERVAEVGARFTLDAMPGKQMSIDADMRAGVIDMEEAQRRRDVISQESKMFGAMDGAMKFVKGDSIAGMIRGEHRGRYRHRHHPARHLCRGSPGDLRHPDHRRRPRLPDPLAHHRHLGRHPHHPFR